MTTLTHRKNHVLRIINALQQEAWIASLETFLDNLLQQNKAYLYAKSLQQNIDIQAMIVAQNYQKANTIAAFGALDEEESLESLLTDFSA